MKKLTTRALYAILIAGIPFAAVSLLSAQTQGQAQNPPPPVLEKVKPADPAKAPEVPAKPLTKSVIEEIVARVNNEIITRSEFERARAQMRKELQDDCEEAARTNPANCTPEKLAKAWEQREPEVLRDLIDTSLLVQRGKDLGINVEPQVIKQLDEIRQQNNLPDLETLEKKVEEAGIAWEEYKNSFRSRILTQEVVYRDVYPDLQVTDAEVQQLYTKNKEQFQRPEQVILAEIFVSTEGKAESEIPALEQKAKTLLDRVKKGEDFNQLAKRFSDGTTAKQGGDLGTFHRGQLAKELEDQVFKMKRGDVTDVIHTRTGFLVLKVEQRYEEGIQPLEKVKNEVEGQIRYEKLQPAVRAYLTKLREESYVLVKPGYVDVAGTSTAPIEEVQPTPDTPKGKKGKNEKSDKKDKKDGKGSTDKKDEKKQNSPAGPR